MSFQFQAKHHLMYVCMIPKASSGGSTVKNPPKMQETQEKQAQSLGSEDPLEEEMATHFSSLAWEIP